MYIEEAVNRYLELKPCKNWIESIEPSFFFEFAQTVITAYEKEKEEHKKECHNCDEYTARLGELETKNRMLKSELEKEKEKNKKIDESCRKELAFERRLKRENREPDEFNQGRFYVSENIRKIIEEE